jgi:hypothetical protein
MGNAMIDHWLLNIAKEFPCSLGALFPSVECDYLNVKEIPGCKPEGYAESLVELSKIGFITLESDFPEDDVDSKLGVSHIIEWFVQLPKEAREVRYVRRSTQSVLVRQPRRRVRFQLTTAGGQEWERLAEPDWSSFFTQSGDETTGDVELASPNLNLLMARMGWFRGLNGERIKVDTIRLETCANYQVLYWKRLPLVYRVLFSTNPAEPQWTGERREEPVWFRQWWSSTDSWYKKPWELPIWPTG